MFALDVLFLLEFGAIRDFLTLNLLIDAFDGLRELFLILSHLFALLDAFFVIVEHIGDWDGANRVEQQEIGESSDHDDFKSRVAGREERKNTLDARVWLLAFLDESRDVLDQLNLINAEHDSKSHANPDTELLLLVSQNRLRESEQDVENDSEAETPVNFHVGIVGEIDGQVVASVLISASSALETLLCSNDLVKSALVLRIL